MSAERIRILLEDILREYLPAGGGRGLFEHARDKAQREKIPIDNDFHRALFEHFWTLARAGIVAIMPRDIPVVGGILEEKDRHGTFFITDLGKKVLAEPSIAPYDWDRYQQTVTLKLTGHSPDGIVLVHLGEAVRGWQSGLYRSSAVMLGCAVERLILMLAARLRDAKLPAPADRLDGMLKKVTPITAIYDVVHEVIEHLVADRKLPGDIADIWDQRLTAGFQHARILRNASGHPTDAIVTPDDAYSGLLLFPGLYAFIEKLIVALPTPPTPTT